jgi:hypothetical protein
MPLAEIDAMIYAQVFGPKNLGSHGAGLEKGRLEGSYDSAKILLEARFGALANSSHKQSCANRQSPHSEAVSHPPTAPPLP